MSFCKSSTLVKFRTSRFLYNLITFLILAILLDVIPAVNAQEFPVKSYSTQNGLPHNEVRCIAQDNNGLMWFSTRFGAVNYDGHYWNNINYPDLNLEGHFNVIHFDKNNHLWLVTESKEVATWDGKEWNMMCSNRDNIRGYRSSVKAFYEDSTGLKIALYDSGMLHIFDGVEWKKVLPPKGKRDIQNILVIDDTLHVLMDNRLYEYNNGLFTESRFVDIKFASPVVRFYYEKSTDTTEPKLWYFSEGNIGYIENQKDIILAKISRKVSESFKDSNPSILPDGFGGVWIGSSKDLLHFDQHGIATPYDALGGLGAQGVTSLFRDRENNVWVSSTRGLKRVLSYSFLNYKRTNGLLQNEVTALCYLEGGEVVCGHSKGISIITNSGIEKINLPNFFSSNSNINIRIMDIIPDKREKGALWLTTDVVGLIHMDANRRFKRIFESNDYYSLSTMVQYDEKTILIGSNHGLLSYDIEKDSCKEIRPEKSVFVRYIYRKNDDIYLGTVRHGVIKYDGRKFTNYHFDHYFKNSVYTIADCRDTLFIGTKAGLYYLDQDMLKSYKVANGVINEPVYLLVVNGDDLWVGGNNGVYRITDNIMTKYTTANGFVGTETNRKAGLVTPEGDVWIGTVEGLSRFTGDIGSKSSEDVLPKIKTISIDGEMVDPSHDIIIPYDNNNLIFVIEYLAYRNEEDAFFEYRLVNNSTNNKNVFETDSREVYYPNLQPGKYSLEVRAKNAEGQWGDLVSVSTFKVEKPFFKTVWFYLLLNIVVLGILIQILYIYFQKKKVHFLSGKVAIARKRIEKIVTSSNTILFQLDKNGDVIYMSPGVVGLSGDVRFKSIDKEVVDTYVDKEDVDLVNHIGEKLSRSKFIKEENYHIRFKTDGKNSEWFQVGISPIIERNEFVGINVVARNINELKHLEDQLRHAQKLEAIGQLAGSIAHDFNNLLTAIQGYNELARNEKISIELIHNYLDELDENVDRATNLTQKLLAFSRKQKLNLEYLDMNEVVADLLKMLKRLIGQVNLTVDLDDSTGIIKADSGQLEQVIINLVVNARDAVNGEGRIKITTGRYVSKEENGFEKEWVRLSISDNGSGIPEEIQDKLFEPFFTTKPAGKGTGLGLSTVYGIIKQSNGRLTFDTKKDTGTTFHVDLPKCNYAGELRKQTDSHDDEKRLNGNEKILVIEDENTVSEYTSVVLTKYGYKVDIISSGEKILNDVDYVDHFDLLLIDIILPGPNGNELAKIIRKKDSSKKIVFMSGYEEAYLMKKGFDLNDAPLIKKPFKSIELISAIRKMLDQ